MSFVDDNNGVVDAAYSLLNVLNHSPSYLRHENGARKPFINPLDKGPDYINMLFQRQSKLLIEALQIQGSLRRVWNESRMELMEVRKLYIAFDYIIAMYFYD